MSIERNKNSILFTVYDRPALGKGTDTEITSKGFPLSRILKNVGNSYLRSLTDRFPLGPSLGDYLSAGFLLEIRIFTTINYEVPRFA